MLANAYVTSLAFVLYWDGWYN